MQDLNVQNGRATAQDAGCRVFASRLFLLAPLAFLGLFYFYPLLSIFRLSLVPEGRPALTGLRGLTSTPYYARTLWFTTWQAALSTLLTLLGFEPPTDYLPALVKAV